MTRAIILVILIYQRFAPTRLRGRCIFRESCSAHVLEGARSGGAGEAWRRLRHRGGACRSGYRVVAPAGTDPRRPAGVNRVSVPDAIDTCPKPTTRLPAAVLKIPM